MLRTYCLTIIEIDFNIWLENYEQEKSSSAGIDPHCKPDLLTSLIALTDFACLLAIQLKTLKLETSIAHGTDYEDSPMSV